MFSPKLHIALALLAVWVSHECAAQIAAPSDTDVPKRVKFERFSLIPPLGEGWVREKKRNLVIYRKKLSMTHTLAASVEVSRISYPRTEPPTLDPSSPDFTQRLGEWAAQEAVRDVAFFEALVKRQEESLATGRHRAISFVSRSTTAREDKKALCEVYDATSEDRGVPGWEGRVFILTVQGLICWHYGFDWLLHGDYSERWLTGENPSTSFQEDAKTFIKGVRFDGKLAPEKPYYED